MLLFCVIQMICYHFFFFFFSSRRRHTRLQGDWSSDVCSSDLPSPAGHARVIRIPLSLPWRHLKRLIQSVLKVLQSNTSLTTIPAAPYKLEAPLMLHRLKKPGTSQAATPWCRAEGWR